MGQKKNKNIFIKNKTINLFMLNGKKNTSELILKKIFEEIQKESKKNSYFLIKSAIINNMSIVYFKLLNKKTRRKQQNFIPFLLNKNYRIIFALKFIIQTAKEKLVTSFYKNLKNEFIFSTKNLGNSVKKKKNISVLVYNKKTFAHYRWF